MHDEIDNELPGVLEFTGEFGAEINSFIPFVYWLHLSGLMERRVVLTYHGMRSFYFFLSDERVTEKAERRKYVAPDDRPQWLPNRNDHQFQWSAFEAFPDFRGHFIDGALRDDKPILVVHNKYTSEWRRAPVNYLSIEVLDELFTTLKSHFAIYYFRSGLFPARRDYSMDQQDDWVLNDLPVVRKHGIKVFDEHLLSWDAEGSYNRAKLRLYAHAFHHITVQGGNAHLIALFSGNLATVFHRYGQEILHSYEAGHFACASNPSPLWLIARNDGELRSTFPVYAGSKLVIDRVFVGADRLTTIEALSPTMQRRSSNEITPDLHDWWHSNA